MTSKITAAWLKEKGSCSEGYSWFIHQRKRDEILVLNQLIKEERYEWTNWLIVRRMSRPQYLAYAIYAAEQVLDIFERKYPNDKRPHLAIEAAKKCLENDTPKNRKAAAAAAADAYADAAAYYAAYAYATACAADAAYAYAASYAASYAADATYAAAYTAAYATDDAYADAAYADAAAAAAAANSYAYYAAAAARKQMQIKILTYGISLLEIKKERESKCN